MKINYSKKIIIPTSITAIVVVVGLSLGFGLGFGLNRSTSDSPLIPNSKSITFKTQSVNDQITSALSDSAFTADGEYNNVSSVFSASQTKISLDNSAGDNASFEFKTGSSAKIYNGYRQNQNLYLPIQDDSTGGATFAKLATIAPEDSDKDTGTYIYLDSLGTFNSANKFVKSFIATDLTNSISNLKLDFNTDETLETVPQPTDPNTYLFNFSISNIDQGFQNVLSTTFPVSNTDNFYVNDLSYLQSSDPDSITFNGYFTNGDFSISLQTGPSNLIVYSYGFFFIPIVAKTVDGKTYTYAKLQFTNYLGSPILYFEGLTTNATLENEKTFFINLDDSSNITANLEFAIGN